jgi:hypothetical protein
MTSKLKKIIYHKLKLNDIIKKKQDPNLKSQ